MSEQSGDLSLTNIPEATVGRDRCPERVATADEWRPALLYELGVPPRPLILRGALLTPPPPTVDAPEELFLFLLGGMGLHWTAANNACNTFMSSFPLI